MEIFLNLAWAALAIALVAAWLRTADRGSHTRRGQIIAIVVLIAILFPVISVSDDLMAVQNTSETDSCYRRDHLSPSDVQPLMHTAALASPQAFSGIVLGFLRRVSPGQVPMIAHDAPALAPIENRPPPAA